jgi:hypothetical protein
MGMYDAEDGGIYRCLDCMHEIWDGVCSSCGRVYSGHEDYGDNVSDEEYSGLGVEDAFLEMGFPNGDLSAFLMNGHPGGIYFHDREGDDDDDNGEQIDAGDRIMEVDGEDEQSDDDENSLDSFIDDEEASSQVSGHIRHSHFIDRARGSNSNDRRRRRLLDRVVSPGADSVIELTGDEGWDDAHSSPVQPARAGGTRNSASYEGDGHASNSPGPPFRGRRGRIVVVSSDAEPSSEGDRQSGHSS